MPSISVAPRSAMAAGGCASTPDARIAPVSPAASRASVWVLDMRALYVRPEIFYRDSSAYTCCPPTHVWVT